jgi:hypothetical protein
MPGEYGAGGGGAPFGDTGILGIANTFHGLQIGSSGLFTGMLPRA